MSHLHWPGEEGGEGEALQGDQQQEGGVPAVSLRPVALLPLAEHVLAQTLGVLVHGAVGNVPVSGAARRPHTLATWDTRSLKLQARNVRCNTDL